MAGTSPCPSTPCVLRSASETAGLRTGRVTSGSGSTPAGSWAGVNAKAGAGPPSAPAPPRSRPGTPRAAHPPPALSTPQSGPPPRQGGPGACGQRGVVPQRAGRGTAGRDRLLRHAWDTGRVPSSVLRRTALTAAALAWPVSWVARAAWGLPTALGAHRRRLRPPWPARRTSSTASSTTRCPAPRCRRRTRGTGCCGSGTRSGTSACPAARSRWPPPSSRTTPPSSPSPGSVTPARCWRSTGPACWSTRSGATASRRPRWSAPRGCTRRRCRSTALPQVDAVLISHDHYDHLDLPTVRALAAQPDARRSSSRSASVSTCARGACPTTRIVELDWDDAPPIGELTLTCTEARHFSGRFLARNTTLWASWVIAGPRHRVFFGGDTGYTPAFAGIGARFGPFDLTLLPIGAYNDAWRPIHMDPEEAVRAHGDLGGRVLLPVHWATFNLAFHRWAEPAQRLLAAAERSGATVTVPRPGRADRRPGARRSSTDWWTAVGSAADRPDEESGRPRPGQLPTGAPSGVTRTASCGSRLALHGVDRRVEDGGDHEADEERDVADASGCSWRSGRCRASGWRTARPRAPSRRASTPSRRTGRCSRSKRNPATVRPRRRTWSAKKTPSHGPIQ